MDRRQFVTALAALPAVAQVPGKASEKFRLRAGLVAYSYRERLAAKTLTYDDLIHRVADWGLDGLDCTVYWFPDTSDTFLASLRKTAFKNGVAIYNAGVRVRLAQPTADLQMAEVENIKKWVDVTEKIGASHMRVFGGPIPKGATEQQAIDWSVEVLKRGAEYAGTRGVTLGVEDDGGLTVRAKPTIEIAKRADSPWVGINADSGNLPEDGYDQFQTLLPYATSVHLKPIISGKDGKKEKADWKRLLTMLGKSGYKGYVGLEYEGNTADAEVPGYAMELHRLVRELSL